jgi:hypothetical protein
VGAAHGFGEHHGDVDALEQGGLYLYILGTMYKTEAETWGGGGSSPVQEDGNRYKVRQEATL